MAIGVPKTVRCKNWKCRYKFLVVIGDVRPQEIKCPKCGHRWLFMK